MVVMLTRGGCVLPRVNRWRNVFFVDKGRRAHLDLLGKTSGPYRLAGWLLGLSLVGGVGCANGDGPEAATLPGNFHVLQPERAYRSAQPTADQLRVAIETHGIKTVINLRGTHPGRDWYDREAAVCKTKGVALVSHAISSRSLPPPELLTALVNTLKTAEQPILIHCQGGSDRSGLASALYRIVVQGQTNERAMQELSEVYWHFRDRKPCMGKLVEIYEPGSEWLAAYAEKFETISCAD